MKHIVKNALKVLPFAFVRAGLALPFPRLDALAPLRPYFDHPGLRNYWRRHPNRPDREKRVLIFGLRSNAASNLAVFEKVFSDAFRFNGANVQMLLCGDVLPSCDGASVEVPDWVICRACRTQRKDYRRNYPNDFIFFADYIGHEEIAAIRREVDGLTDEALEHHHFLGVKVGRHAADSVSYAFQFIFDNRNPEHLRVLRDSVFRGMLCVKVAQQLYERERPTHLFTLHGCYASWGPFAEYLSQRGVLVYVYRKLLNPGMGYFDFPRWTDDPNDIPAREVWEQRRDRALTAAQRERVQAFFQAKRSGRSADYLIFYENKKGEDDRLVDLLKGPQRKFVLYMHSLYDRGFEEATSDCFDSHVEWLTQTVQHFGKMRDALLFIKPHPAENSIFEQRKHGGEDAIFKIFGHLPQNVTIIKRDCPYTSYDLMDRGCIGITYYGTVGLEHAYAQKPVLVGGRVHYAEAGATYRARSREDYFRLLDDPGPLYRHPLEQRDLIERYAYHYYFRPNIRIPFFRDDMIFLGHCIDWKVLADYDRFIEADPVMNHVARSILAGAPVVNPD